MYIRRRREVPSDRANISSRISVDEHSISDFTEEELSRIAAWKPYRDDWPIDRNVADDGIAERYGAIVDALTSPEGFDAASTQDSGMSNYLEYVLFPKGNRGESVSSILLCICLCAPVAAYGEIVCSIEKDCFAWGFLDVDAADCIESEELLPIEMYISDLLEKNGIKILGQRALLTTLPDALRKKIHSLQGDEYLMHALFQFTD